MNWAHPHISKIYEALGAIADHRVSFIEGKTEATVSSSNGDKTYIVKWNQDLSQMIATDPYALFQRKLSYPMIAVLLLKGKLNYDPKLTEVLKGVKWKNINVQFKNDYDKAVVFVLDELAKQGVDVESVKSGVQHIIEQFEAMDLSRLGS